MRVHMLFLQKKNSLPFVEEHDMINTFHHGLDYDKLMNRWGQKPPNTINYKFAVANAEVNEKEVECE